MADEENEFERPEKTPANAVITAGEKRIVFVAVRTFVKVTVPLLPKLATVAGPALVAVLIGLFHNWGTKAEVEHKTTVAYGTLEPAVAELQAEVKELKGAIAQVAASVAHQADLALASRPGFDDKGKPEGAPAAAVAAKKRRVHGAPPVDPTIVKKVQEDAAKNQALKAKLAAPAAPSVVVPKELPAEVPKVEQPKPPTAGQEWPPPVPSQPRDSAL